MHRSVRHRPFGLCLVLTGATVALSCSTALQHGAEKVVAESLDAVNAPQNRSRVGDLLDSEEIREATRKLTGVVLDTAKDDLGNEDLRRRIQEVALGFVKDVTPALAEAFDAEVWPGIRDKLEESLALVIDELLSEENLERFRDFAAETAAEVLRQTSPEVSASISAGISRGVENAFETVFAQVVPVLEEAFERDHGPEVRELARHAAYGAMLGITEAMNETSVNEVFDRERDEIFERLEQSAQKTALRLKWGLGLLGLAGIGLVGWMWYGRRQRDAAVKSLVEEIQHQEGVDLDRVRESVRRKTGGEYLDKHLSRRGRT